MGEKIIHPADKYAGEALRKMRQSKGVSQESLAESLGITFQQIQKYESGRNRISVSKLSDIAIYLKVPVSAFFNTPDNEAGIVERFIKSQEQIKILREIGNQILTVTTGEDQCSNPS